MNPEEDAPVRPDFSHAAPMVLDRIVGDIANDTRVGYELFGLLCVGAKPVTWRADGALARQALYGEIFRSTLAEAGFPKAKKADLLFKSASNNQRKDLVVGAVITHIDVKVCYPFSGSDDFNSQKGKGTIQITWNIYSSRQKEVVFEAQGTGKLPRGSSESVEGVILAAFTDGARQLIADPAFVQFATTYELAASKSLSMIRIETPTPYQNKAQDGLKKPFVR